LLNRFRTFYKEIVLYVQLQASDLGCNLHIKTSKVVAEQGWSDHLVHAVVVKEERDSAVVCLGDLAKGVDTNKVDVADMKYANLLKISYSADTRVRLRPRLLFSQDTFIVPSFIHTTPPDSDGVLVDLVSYLPG
jgi:hypothetical protein